MFVSRKDAYIVYSNIEKQFQVSGLNDSKLEGYFNIFKDSVRNMNVEANYKTLTPEEAKNENKETFIGTMKMNFRSKEELEEYNEQKAEHGRLDVIYFEVMCPKCRKTSYARYKDSGILSPAEEVSVCRYCNYLFMSFAEGVKTLSKSSNPPSPNFSPSSPLNSQAPPAAIAARERIKERESRKPPSNTIANIITYLFLLCIIAVVLSECL